MSMLGLAYQTRDMKMCQEIALHSWIQSWIGGGGTVQFKVRAIFSTLQQQRTLQWTAQQRQEYKAQSD
jgi:hypothetical protein